MVDDLIKNYFGNLFIWDTLNILFEKNDFVNKVLQNYFGLNYFE